MNESNKGHQDSSITDSSISGVVGQAGGDLTQVQVDGDRAQVIGENSGLAIGTLIVQAMSPSAPRLETFFGIPYRRNPYFTGRAEILEKLHGQLSQNQVQAISGLGGMGKTQMALEYAYRCYYSNPRIYDWVLWVRADTEVNLASDFANLAGQLQLPAAQLKPEEQISAVKQWLATHNRWLLIFDNADRPEWLESFLPINPEGRVLLTSRHSVFDLLGVTKPLTLDVLTDNEAVDFLFKRVDRDRAADHEGAAIELATELGNLPLALEQAGAFILRKNYLFPLYLKTYRKRCLEQLEKVKPQIGNYPASVLTTWSLNFQAVEAANATSADVLRLSAMVSPDAIPYRLLMQGAEHLGEQLAAQLQVDDVDEAVMAIADLLEPLSQYSLIQWEPEHERYSIHRMVQAVVRDGMTEETQQLWVTRMVNALDAAFPKVVEYEEWDVCAQFLPHALIVIDRANGQAYESLVFARLLTHTAYYLSDQVRYNEAEPLLRKSLEIRKQLSVPVHPDVAASLHTLALLYRDQGRYSKAEPLYSESLEMRKQLFGEAHPDVAASLHNLGIFYLDQGRYSEAEPLLLKSRTLSKQLSGEVHPTVATSLSSLAILYDKQRRYSEAEPLYKESLEMRKQLFGEAHPDVAASLHNLATFYLGQGRYSEAEPLLIESQNLFKQLLGAVHPTVAISLSSQSAICFSLSWSEAEPLLIESMEITKQALGAGHLAVAATLYNLAQFYCIQGRHNEAEPLLRESMEITKQALGAGHLAVAASLHSLAEVYYSQGRYNEAERHYIDALAMRRQLLGAVHPNIAASLTGLATLYRDRGRHVESEKLLIEALVVYKYPLGLAYPDIVSSLNDLAALSSLTTLSGLYFAQGRYSEAEPLLAEELAIAERQFGSNHPMAEMFRQTYADFQQVIQAADISE
jgi:tetratricopeptide (TPR) repeat protein